MRTHAASEDDRIWVENQIKDVEAKLVDNKPSEEKVKIALADVEHRKAKYVANQEHAKRAMDCLEVAKKC